MRKKFIFVPLAKKILTTYICNRNYNSFNFSHDQLIITRGEEKKDQLNLGINVAGMQVY